MWARRNMGTQASKQCCFMPSATQYCALALLLSVGLSSSAFFLPDSGLVWLLLVDFLLVLNGLYLKNSLTSLLKLAVVQLAVTLPLYYVLHGQAQLFEGVIVVLRVFLAMLPGWWLSSTQRPERLGEVLCWGLPSKWAFVISASIGLMPFMLQETKEIYAIQCLRGANISAKALRNPKNWLELINCVLLPVLIQLLKLSKQMATAAKLRHFGKAAKATHWPSTGEDK
ncbi:energy-coupling factor transporter transmembrane component T [Shewanella sp. 10N.286.48.B5]|uniref:energy-coupling factor transporter transmembrane component T n=1 Tax=Shewanella sp. 10N.286.48.B5 TaxID=1880834 RepID=UPI000C83EE38|nr:energy-coupling factor transporter transmembrane component T [Shewanella sp. 10N.286.48.B5]PMH86136.1 cobalt ABC transporter permease [Shewanella sp. 10N.286.48.B5]